MNELTVRNSVEPAIMEEVMVNGDLSKLTPQQRISYYNSVCQSVGLNPLTKPFSYIRLNGKLTLYALKDATDQLRKINGVSIGMPKIDYMDDLIMVTVSATDKTGKKDSDIGVVNLLNLKGDMKANAIMKAVTKAKRRVTLSISGLGWLDETETETIPGAEIIEIDDEIIDQPPAPSVGHDLVDVAIAEGGKVSSSMSLETAEAVTSSDGTRYGDIETEKLVHMANAITKSIKKNGISHEEHETRQMKLDAIRVILESRNG